VLQGVRRDADGTTRVVHTRVVEVVLRVDSSGRGRNCRGGFTFLGWGGHVTESVTRDMQR